MTFVIIDQQFPIVPGNNACHVGHAAVTQLDVISVAHFVQPVMGWEVPSEQIEKFFSDVIGNMLAEGWVKPHDVTFAALLFGAGVVDVIDPPSIPALLQGFLIWWQGLSEMFAVARVLRKALCQHRG